MIIILGNKFRLKIYVLILLTSFILPFIIRILIAGEKNNYKYIALIIDDFGNNTSDTQDFLDLKIKFTGAVMPGLENSEKDMLNLKKTGKEIILHMPMEPHHGKKSWLGPNCLLKNLDDEQVKKNILKSLEEIKFAVGVNNHMGSKIMEDERILNIFFKILKEKELIFVDSKTTNKSIAKNLAQKYNLGFYERDIFIDDKNLDVVKKNLVKALEIAKGKKFVIAIGHVGPAGGKITAQAIKEFYDKYKNQKIKFVTLSELSKIIF